MVNREPQMFAKVSRWEVRKCSCGTWAKRAHHTNISWATGSHDLVEAQGQTQNITGFSSMAKNEYEMFTHVLPWEWIHLPRMHQTFYRQLHRALWLKYPHGMILHAEFITAMERMKCSVSIRASYTIRNLPFSKFEYQTVTNQEWVGFSAWSYICVYYIYYIYQIYIYSIYSIYIYDKIKNICYML